MGRYCIYLLPMPGRRVEVPEVIATEPGTRGDLFPCTHHTKLLKALVTTETNGFELTLPFLSSIGFKHYYRVTHLLADLGWVDLDLGCSTILPWQ